MKRVALGWLLILQALAHVSADMWTSINDPIWFTTVLCAVVLAPIDAFVFEPIHFVMERAMLRGIRARAERVASTR